jgi:hypothetical protein
MEEAIVVVGDDEKPTPDRVGGKAVPKLPKGVYRVKVECNQTFECVEWLEIEKQE